MLENYPPGHMPEQFSMHYQLQNNSEYVKSSKQKKNRKQGVNANKHLTPAMVAHHHYHGASDPYSHGYYSDITQYPVHQYPVHQYPVNEQYGTIKDKKQRDKSTSRSPKVEKDSGYLAKFMTIGKKSQQKGKPKDNEDIYAIPRPSLVAGENIQRSAMLRNIRQSTGQMNERHGMSNSKSMGNLHVRGRSKDPRNSSGSSEEIYESMDDINNRKSIQSAMRRQHQSRTKKTGHPLFDHLRTKSQENIISQERSMTPQNLRTSQERVPPPPVWPRIDPTSKHAYYYIDDSSDIYSSSNEELDKKPEMFYPKRAPMYHQNESNVYDDVYSVPRFSESASRRLYQDMRTPDMRHH